MLTAILDRLPKTPSPSHTKAAFLKLAWQQRVSVKVISDVQSTVRCTGVHIGHGGFHLLARKEGDIFDAQRP